MERGLLLRIAVVAAAYVAAGKFGLSFASVNPSASAVWPPTGIAIAALLLLGSRVWPGVFLGAYVVNVTTAGTVATSLAIATGNTLEGLVGAGLVLVLCAGPTAFDRARDVFAFTIAAIVATAVGATIGVTTLTVADLAPSPEYGAVWLTWWLGDLAGALVIAPLIVTWVQPRRFPLTRAVVVELVVMFTALIAISVAVFSDSALPSLARYPFVTFPFFVWAAYRFGRRGATTSVFIAGAIGIAGTIAGHGAFARDEPNEALVLVQSFLAVASLTSLALAAGEKELRARDAQLRQVEERKVADREEFLSVAAHELRTPITSLRLAVQMLLRRVERGDELAAEDLRRGLVTVNEQSAKLARLVSQLLEGVRADAGRTSITRELVDISSLVLTIVDQVRPMANRDIAFEGGSATAAVDPLRIEQVVRNLLDNAVKFSPRGSRIDVSVATRDDLVMLSVRDRGVGVPADRREQLFQRYRQARATDEPSGLGLGLYVSRQIVELHGGRIWAEFPADGGTRIVATFPAELSAIDRAN